MVYLKQNKTNKQRNKKSNTLCLVVLCPDSFLFQNKFIIADGKVCFEAPGREPFQAWFFTVDAPEVTSLLLRVC